MAYRIHVWTVVNLSGGLPARIVCATRREAEVLYCIANKPDAYVCHWREVPRAPGDQNEPITETILSTGDVLRVSRDEAEEEPIAQS